MCQPTVVTSYSLVKISTSTEIINGIWFLLCWTLARFDLFLLCCIKLKWKKSEACSFLFLFFLFFFLFNLRHTFSSDLWVNLHCNKLLHLFFGNFHPKDLQVNEFFLGSALNCLYQAMFISKWKLFSMTGANTRDKYCTCKLYHFGLPQTLGRTVKPLRYSSISV